MVTSVFPTDKSQINSLCIGSGRFLRAVLVPALIASNLHPAIIQTRGRTFMDYCANRIHIQGGKEEDDPWSLTYEVDTVQHDGTIQTDEIPCYGAGSLGTPATKSQVLNLLHQISNLAVIGVGVTEAGLANARTQAMLDLFEILMCIAERFKAGKMSCDNPNGKICIVNTDNVSQNGDVLIQFMMELCDDLNTNNDDKINAQTMREFLNERVVFHNSMVDRITSQRPDSNGLIPRAEPTPAKALVIEDLHNDLPTQLSTSKNIEETYGVVVRSKLGRLDADIALKLRVANGTHTAVAHVMALCRMLMTDVLSDGDDGGAVLLMQYLDSFFEHQIKKGVEISSLLDATADDAQYVYDDWRRR